MMHRINHSNATAIDLQNAAELRRSQAASAQTTQKPGAQYNFAEIFGGSNWGAAEEAATPSSSTVVASPGGFHSAIATATAMVVGKGTGARQPIATPISTATTATTTTPEPASATTAATATTPATTAAATVEAAATPTTPAAVTVTPPGVGALVTAIMNGSFQPTYVTNPAKLQEITPAGTDYMPNFYYASDQTAAQLAQLLGGTVVQKPAFGQDAGWSEPNANFIQLPNGQSFNAADVAYYAKTGSVGANQLTSDITAAINQGSAWTNYYQQGGAMPTFAMGYVGPPISGSTYSAGMIGADGNVINAAMQPPTVKGT
jgi:hypothetical protein